MSKQIMLAFFAAFVLCNVAFQSEFSGRVRRIMSALLDTLDGLLTPACVARERIIPFPCLLVLTMFAPRISMLVAQNVLRDSKRPTDFMYVMEWMGWPGVALVRHAGRIRDVYEISIDDATSTALLVSCVEIAGMVHFVLDVALFALFFMENIADNMLAWNVYQMRIALSRLRGVIACSCLVPVMVMGIANQQTSADERCSFPWSDAHGPTAMSWCIAGSTCVLSIVTIVSRFFGTWRGFERDNGRAVACKSSSWRAEVKWPPPLDVRKLGDDLSEDDIPDAYLCPITHSVMREPATTYLGTTYDRFAIERWLETKDTDPITQESLDSTSRLVPNYALRQAIEHWVGSVTVGDDA
jgi:hypothetical protein